MCNDQDVPAGSEVGHQNRSPQRYHARHDVLQTFGCRKYRRVEVYIPRVVGGMFGTRAIHGRGRYVETSSPQLGLFDTMALCRLFLVEALQRPVVALIESPVANGFHVGLTKLLQCAPIGFYCAGQEGGEHDVEMQSGMSKGATCFVGLRFALRTERYVVPTSEQIAGIPRTLAVPKYHQGAHRSGWLRCCVHAARLEPVTKREGTNT